MKKQMQFRRFGTMVGSSRNTVMTVETMKKWIDITSELGYNCLLLYMEDTYELKENPYFGYMRARYSQAELKEIDRYAGEKGMEVIPCIQTLGHLSSISRWPAYRQHMDTGDILLVGDEAVYQLIDQMFETMAECFSGKVVNIGMDEAHMLGRGKYYDQHGDRNHIEIMMEHILRVSEIGRKYGFTLTMWSDMFYKLATGGGYRDPGTQIDDAVKTQIPDNVELVYWDYYSTDRTHYRDMLLSSQKIRKDTWFAGGLWSWMGMAPHNGYSIDATKAAFEACLDTGVQDVFLTLWGGECSKYALLPSLYYAAELAKGNTDEESIKKGFAARFGISFDDFMLLDMPETPDGARDKVISASKYLLYNDCFCGLADSTLSGGENKQYEACAEILKKYSDHEEWGYLFTMEQALCEVLSVKAELGANTRAVYQNRCEDKEALAELIRDYQELQEKLQSFHKAYRNLWYKENKTFGFEVHDVRLGGLMQRMKSCAERLQDLYDGKIDSIEELETIQLDLSGNGNTFKKEHMKHMSWLQTVSTNMMLN